MPDLDAASRAGRRLMVGFVLATTIAAGGCATIAQGDQQEVRFGTTPPEAHCVVTRDGTTLGSVTTPGSLHLSRSSDILEVTCIKQGYMEASSTVDSSPNAAFWYNFYWLYPVITFPVTLVGLVVDWSTGDYHSYESPVVLTLAPVLVPVAPAPEPTATPAGTT